MGLAFALVGLSLCVYAVSWVKPRPKAQLVDGSVDFKPAEKPPAEASAPFGPAELTALLALHKNPSTQRFASDFLADPGLRAVWDKYRADGDLAAAARSLRAAPRFRELLERHSPDKRFEAAADAVMADPRLAPATAAFGRL